LLATRDVAIVEERFPRVRQVDKNGSISYATLGKIEASTRLIIFRYQYRPFGYIIIHGRSSIRALSPLRMRKRKDKEPALQMVGLRFKGKGEDFKELLYRNSDGEPAREETTFDGSSWEKQIRTGCGGYVTFTPNPYGLLGIHTLDKPMDVTVGHKGHPFISAGFNLKGTRTLLSGGVYDCSWIVTQDGGGVEDDLFERLSYLWGVGEEARGPVYAPESIRGGRVLPQP